MERYSLRYIERPQYFSWSVEFYKLFFINLQYKFLVCEFRNLHKILIKLIWNLPRKCRSYFIEPVLAPGISPPRVSLMTRFLNFFHGLLASDSVEIQVLSRLAARDGRTSIGANLRAARDESGLDPWVYGGQRMKEALLEFNGEHALEVDEWRIPFLSKLLQQRMVEHYNGAEDTSQLDDLIDSLVSN